MIIIFLSAIFTGISIFGVPKLAEIDTDGNILKQTIEMNKKIAEVDYQTAVTNLNTTIKSLENEKQEYEEILSLNSNSGYNILGENESYTQEFIWVRLGTYAKENNLDAKFKLEPIGVQTNTSICNINCTLLGDYIEIIDFIYSIEDDDDLNFIVENLEMIPSDDKVQATFTTKNVLILK